MASNEWKTFDKFVQQRAKEAGLPQQDAVDLSMLAKFGAPVDNEIRNAGSQIRSPVIDPKTNLNFEQRILQPEKYGSIDNGDGTVSTHRMAWGEADGKYVAFPTIVQDKKSGDLRELADDEAFKYAMENKEYRAFDKPEDAESYAEGGYKKFWGLGSKK